MTSKRDQEVWPMKDFYCCILPEPALGIGKLGSRLGPPIGGGLAQES